MDRRTVIAAALSAVTTVAAFAQLQPFSATAELEASESGEEILTVRLSIPPQHYLYADKVRVEATEDVRLSPISPPEPKRKHDELLEETVGVYDHDTALRYSIEAGKAGSFEVSVSYQGCSNEGICYMPQTDTFTLSIAEQAPTTPAADHETDEQPSEVTAPAAPETDWRALANQFTIQGRRSGFLTSDDFIAFLDASESGRGMEENELGAVFAEKGVWVLIALILLGGLALNLTPCVLPMIPINIAIIGAGAQASSKKKGFLLGGMYGAGIALVYGALGLVVVLTGAKFGALNASPWFNFAIAVIFVLLALAMFDVFIIDFSRFQNAGGPDESKRGRFLTAFFMGGVAALLAGACVAPVLISVLLLSADLFAGGNPAGLLLPFLLGVGMALPWPFAGAGLSFLPKPGAWMTRVKVVFGIFILLFAGWYAYLGVSLLRHQPPEMAAHADGDHSGWHTSLAQGLQTGLRNNQPVFIDFWATWCKNCLKMDRSTFRDPAVVQRLDQYTRIKFQAEDVSAPDVKPVLDHFGVIGLPTYVVLQPKGAAK